ncbi:MAG: depupylase/deamidase Dop, partial [Verrucomicrobiae bacterium]|nr:depupylase/deamidase Dop [Verrucomicrobiae bacterium]
VMDRTLGIETEYGITVDGVESVDVVAESIALVRSYTEVVPPVKDTEQKWDYSLEDPHLDVRGFRVEELLQDFDEAKYFAQDQNRKLSFQEIKSDLVLSNGARFYNDHAHPEYSTPECRSLRDIIAQDKAGERIIEECVRRRNRQLTRGVVKVFKNNTDFVGHSYGTHDNYLMDRRVPFERVVRGLTPFLVTRQIVAGAGKMGIEGEERVVPGHYQISQRADFFSVLVSIDTMNRRPIINTRDEPHANTEKYRRMHVIVGDANLSEVAGALKLGTTSLVLDLLEQDACPLHLELADAVAALKQLSRDPHLKTPLRLADGRTISPVDVQREYLAVAEKRLRGRDAETDWVLGTWRQVLDDLERDVWLCADRLDWVAKWWLLTTFVETEGVSWDDPWLQSIDLEYHNVRRDEGLHAELVRQGRMQRFVTDEEIRQAIRQPPSNTRAYFRGRCVEKFAKEMTSVQWDELAFADGNGEAVVRLLNVFDDETVQFYNAAVDKAGDVATLLRSLHHERR